MARISSRCIRLAMLNADTATPNTYGHMGTFGDILHNVLTAAASRIAPGTTLQHVVFNVVKGEYPSSPSDFDAFIITASAASAFDDVPWIRKLEDYVILLSEQYPKARLFGSCFGHHIICQALLKQYGLRVEKHPRGWEIGVNRVCFTDDFREALEHLDEPSAHPTSLAHIHGRLPSPEAEPEDFDGNALSALRPSVPRSVRLQFVHEDQVVLESPHVQLPGSWTILGFTDHCAIQGVYKAGCVMTLQGHFEFDKFENRETMRMFGAEDELEGDGECLKDTGRGKRKAQVEEDDGELVAEIVLWFLMGTQAGECRGSRQTYIADDGMLTPRSSLEI